MKTKLFILVLIFAASAIFTSCKKDEIIEILPSMSATVDGAAWEATPSVVSGKKYSGYFSFLGYNLNGNKVLIVVKMDGTDVTSGTYTMSLSPFNEDGTLDLPELTTYGAYLGNKDDVEDAATNYYSTSGSLIINSVNEKRINGTFSFSATNKSFEVIEITNGKFSNVKIYD